MENNPYSAPSADLANNHGPVTPHDKKWYSLSGRIGRLRYLAYNSIFILFAALLGILAAIFVPMMASGGSSILMMIGGLLIAALGIAMLVLSIAFMVRRLNDAGRSGWFSLILFIPLVNFALILYLVFAKGSEGMNQFGAPAGDNHMGIYIGAAIYGLFMLAYFTMIPNVMKQYSQYTELAKAASVTAE